MKNPAFLLVAAFVSTGCVVPVASPVGYGEPLGYGHAGVVGYGPGLVYNQPIIVAPPRFSPAGPPVYLHVPSEHHRDWRQHCSHYRACDRPVYFVREPGQRPPPGLQVAPVYPGHASRGGAGPDRRHWAPGRHPREERVGRDERSREEEHRGRGERADRVPGHRPLTQGDPRTR